MPVKDILSTNYGKVDINDRVSRVVGQFVAKKVLAVLVYDKKKFVGLVDQRKFIRVRQDLSNMKVKQVTTKVPQLQLSTKFTEAARLLNTADCHCLPVVQKHQIVGVVDFADVLGKLKTNPKLSNIKVGEISKKPITLKENDPISKALNILKQKHISRIPIVDSAGKLMGIVAERNLFRHYFSFPPWKPGAFGKRAFKSHPAKERDTTRLPVSNEMTKIVYTVTKENSVKEALEIMTEKKIASIVVVDDEIPVGIVTAKDIFRIVSA